jgi:hypothetical protein
VSSDEPQSLDTDEGQEPHQEPRVLGHVTWRTREARPDDPMFGRVFIVSVPDVPPSFDPSDEATHGMKE